MGLTIPSDQDAILSSLHQDGAHQTQAGGFIGKDTHYLGAPRCNACGCPALCTAFRVLIFPPSSCYTLLVIKPLTQHSIKGSNEYIFC